jgi:hypothetical protein
MRKAARPRGLSELQKIFKYTGVLSRRGHHDAADRLCDWIDRRREAQGFTAEQIAGWV